MVVTDVTRTLVEGIAGGHGKGWMEHWISGAQLPPNVNMVATVTLEPGSSVGDHQHDGECEIYRILSGNGMYNDNGSRVEVKPGDVTVCYAGQVHGLENTTDAQLVFEAVIIAG